MNVYLLSETRSLLGPAEHGKDVSAFESLHGVLTHINASVTYNKCFEILSGGVVCKSATGLYTHGFRHLEATGELEVYAIHMSDVVQRRFLITKLEVR